MPSADPARVARELEAARLRLIETGTRNRLVHVNRSAKRPATLGIVAASPDALFERLLREGESLRFRPDPLLAARAAAGEPEEADEEEAAPAFSFSESAPADGLLTRLGPSALERKLLRFYRDAKLVEEEQGVNVLYLALGFLRWTEDERAQTIREAPLLLVPVRLSRDARRSTFDIAAREEDLGLNLPLAERLREQGIVLPPIPEGEDFAPSAYFDAVAEAVSTRPRWSIDREGTELGFFSFAKLLMFHDLEPESWEGGALLAHPLLAGLLARGFDGAGAGLLPEDAPLDRHFAPADLVHVVDADASQAHAIEAVRTGRSLVVQGPPGTGKSQTIANMIASAVHDGKTVLFVAEKMVALEVVHQRLARAGLGLVCLELHARTANKRLVAQELGKTLDHAERAPDLAALDARLTAVRDALDAITQDLHAPIGETGATPHRALGDLARAAGLALPPPQIAVTGLGDLDAKTHARLAAEVAALADATARHGRADAHPWRGIGALALQPLDVARLVPTAEALAQATAALATRAGEVAARIGLPAPESLRGVLDLVRALALVADAPEDVATASALATLEPKSLDQAHTLLAMALADASEIARESAAFIPAAFEADTATIRAGIAAGVGSFLSRLFGRYRTDSRMLASLMAEPLPAAPKARLAAIDRLIALRAQIRSFEEIGDELRTLLGPLWRGRRTEFFHLETVALWVAEARSAGLLPAMTPEEARALRHDAAAARQTLADAGRAVAGAAQDLVARLEIDLPRAFGSPDLAAIPLADLAARAAAYAAGEGTYQGHVDLARGEAALAALGAGDVARRLADGRLAPEDAAEELRHARAEALWRRAIETQPRLAALDGAERHRLVETFARLERERRAVLAATIRARHAAGLPRGALGEMGVIRGEIARKRGHMAIRRLVTRAGGALQRIKPVFLMSPLSVAQYLPPGRIAFDLVVIDEASQVRPEDALGVAARGRQLVVVGDSKQLPPTSFFDRLMVDETPEEDDEEAPGDAFAGAAKATELESILTLCAARGLPERMLLTHYRSRHPSLIEVSNAEFYRRLVLPPAPAATREEDGLVLRRVAGAYDRGGRRTNETEARAVVAAAAAHAARKPARSLGIVTFSTAQRDLVSRLLDEARREDAALDKFIATNEGGESLFVKNLENVQGDERDTILISVGYGPREAGRPLDSMSFGPVSGEGGERRLNVLFTRARFRCEVFASFDPADIDLSRAKGEGPRVFKRFLTFAESGVLEVASPSGRGFDSGFEEDVARVVQGMGYAVDSQVGSSGFFIDLGVRDPARPGRYLMAIECDGARYHTSLWARERDRLRQEILEGLGWRFHRIWSSDWYRRRADEIARLTEALRRVREEPAPPPPPRPVVEPPPEPAPADEPASAPASPTLGEPYAIASPPVPRGVEAHLCPPRELARIVAAIVEVEGPIHAEEVARRVASLFGAQRAGTRIVAATDQALRIAGQAGAVGVDPEGFLATRAQMRTPPVRDRSAAPPSLQRADRIAASEIRAAALRALAENGGLAREECVTAIVRLLGFQRTGPDLRARVEAVISAAIGEGRLRERDGRISPPADPGP